MTRMHYLISTGSSMEGCPDNVGIIIGPRVRGIQPIKEGRRFAVDNDSFHGKFSEAGFMAHLERLAPYRAQCLFVAAPDVVGDAAATLQLFEEWGPRIRELGWPVAWVAQNGASSVPPGCDAVFIGGDTAWKLGAEAVAICREARALDLHVHVGRVNSLKRSLICAHMGAHSVDGTYLAFRGRDRGLKEIGGWLDAAHIAATQPRFI